MQELKREELEAINGFLNSRKRTRLDYRRNHHSKKIDTIENEIEASQDLQRNKMLVELNTPQGSAVRQIAVKPQTNVKCTTRFLAGKMLMFAKLSLKSFIYQLAELFTFPDEIVQAIYDKYQIERVYVYHVLTDTDSTTVRFVVISSLESTFTEPQVRNIIFEVFSQTSIVDRFNKSDEFWKQFNVHNANNQKVSGLFEVESINDPCLVTLAVNPRVFWIFSKSTNKKHKGIKKGAPGMNYENYAED